VNNRLYQITQIFYGISDILIDLTPICPVGFIYGSRLGFPVKPKSYVKFPKVSRKLR
jgi:hypothetical protein